MKTIIVGILVACSIAFAAYLSIGKLDAGAELADARTASKRLRERSEIVLLVAEKAWIGKSEDAVASLATELTDQGYICKRTESGDYEIEDIIFEIREGTVTNLKFFD